jgi:hypothetical protein
MIKRKDSINFMDFGNSPSQDSPKLNVISIETEIKNLKKQGFKATKIGASWTNSFKQMKRKDTLKLQ